MKRNEWIVCERTSRWAGAVRTALARDTAFAYMRPQLREVRTLDELAARLATGPECLAMVEVERASIGRVLEWLADAGREFRQARLVALLDADLVGPAGQPESLDGGHELIAQALSEAGAIEVVDSPRRLDGLLELGYRHWVLSARERAARKSVEASVVEAAWASLPWQGG